MPKRQLVLMKVSEQTRPGGSNPPLGSPGTLTAALARFNTTADGAPESASRGTRVFHGPGLVVEIPTGQDTIAQALITVTDPEFAWPVLTQLCRHLAARMVDVETGQSFGAPA